MNDSWFPDAASAAAAAVAVAVRASLVEQPRAWRVVMLDGIATAGLSYAAYYIVTGLPPGMGGPLNERFAFGASVLISVLGWAVVTRWAWNKWGGGAPK